MALTEEQLKAELESYLKKLAGVMPIGHYWFGIDPKSKPAGVQIYSGQLLARSAYQKHWEFVSGGHRTVLSESEWQSMVEEQGFCPYFSDGDGSTTYRMPLVKGVHPKFVSALLEAGGYTEAGLPNITGATGIYGANGEAYGSFYTISAQGDGFAVTGRSLNTIFDASRSSSIYGNSDTVQPPAVNFLIGEYVIGTIAEIGEAIDESLLASVTQLEAGKLDKTGGGVSGNLSVSGDLFVGGQINASISGTSENAVKASCDAQGRVIDETYATKDEISGVVRSVNGANADADGNVSVSIPVTSVNGMTGAVTIDVAGTKVNNAGTADKATACPNVATTSSSTWTLPSGGTWQYVYCGIGDGSDFHAAGSASGGKKFTSVRWGIAIRKS